MSKDSDNHRRIFDRSDDLQSAAAVRAVLNVDVEDPLEQPGPTHARRRALRVRVIACGLGCRLRETPRQGDSTPAWRQSYLKISMTSLLGSS